MENSQPLGSVLFECRPLPAFARAASARACQLMTQSPGERGKTTGIKNSPPPFPKNLRKPIRAIPAAMTRQKGEQRLPIGRRPPATGTATRCIIPSCNRDRLLQNGGGVTSGAAQTTYTRIRSRLCRRGGAAMREKPGKRKSPQGRYGKGLFGQLLEELHRPIFRIRERCLSKM
jgi:hypothetical protein